MPSPSLDSATPQLQAVIDAASTVSIIATDPEGVITVFNAGAHNMLGYSAEEMIGKLTPAIIHLGPEVVARGRQLSELFGRPIEGFDVFVEYARQGTSEAREWTYVRKDGSHLPVMLTVTAMRDSSGAVTGFLGLATDLSARQRMSESFVSGPLKQTRELQAALDAHAIVTIADVAGNITFANDRFCAISGFTRNELLGKNHRIIRSDRHDPAFYREMWRTIASGRIWQGEICNRAKDGHLYWVASTIVPFLGDNGKPDRYIAVRTDITAQKQTEEDLRLAKNAAETATRAKGDFLALMSHEIRTPINGVMGVTNLLLDTALDTKQRHLAETVQHSADALLTSINDILDFSKIEAGKLDLESLDFDLPTTIEETLELLRPRAKAKSLGLTADLAADVPAFLRSDPGRIRQILLNLLGNALKFTEHGSVTLLVSVQERTDTGVSLRFDVSDTGIGISPEAQQRLFQPFTQADSTTSRQFGGTGLGLAICRQLVELMGGTIALQSEAGLGTTFTFTIRFGIAQAPRAEIQARISGEETGVASFSGLRVLLAEDNAINQMVALGQLERLGLRADVAGNGLEAIEACQRIEYDVVLMDCMMPELDGYGATRDLRHLENMGHFTDSTGGQRRPLHIIAMTANAMTGDREKCIAAGMNDYVTKPILVPALRAALENAGRIRTGGSTSAHAVATSPAAAIDHSQAQVSAQEPVDMERLLEVTDGDRAGLDRLTEIFLRMGGELTAKLSSAVHEKQGEIARSHAHQFAGVCANLGAEALLQHTRRIEQLAAQGNVAEATASLAMLLHEWERVREFLVTRQASGWR